MNLDDEKRKENIFALVGGQLKEVKGGKCVVVYIGKPLSLTSRLHSHFLLSTHQISTKENNFYGSRKKAFGMKRLF